MKGCLDMAAACDRLPRQRVRNACWDGHRFNRLRKDGFASLVYGFLEKGESRNIN